VCGSNSEKNGRFGLRGVFSEKNLPKFSIPGQVTLAPAAHSKIMSSTIMMYSKKDARDESWLEVLPLN
jgi:hypothetical protein